MKKHFRKVAANTGGTSLVELVVTFALIAMFSVAVVYVTGSSMNIYRSATGRAYAQDVCTTLMDKVAGEISGAQPGTEKQFGVVVMDRSRITGNRADYLSYASGACVAFCNRTGSQVYIASENGKLLVHYRPVEDNVRKLKAVDWKFDDAVYNGFSVSSLNFSLVSSENGSTNVLLASVTLKNDKTGYIYSDSRYIRCFNFSNAPSAAKITYGGIKRDGIT